MLFVIEFHAYSLLKKKTNNGVPAQKRNPVFGNTPRSVDRQQATVLTLALSY